MVWGKLMGAVPIRIIKEVLRYFQSSETKKEVIINGDINIVIIQDN